MRLGFFFMYILYAFLTPIPSMNHTSIYEIVPLWKTYQPSPFRLFIVNHLYRKKII